ncbi:MAG TPA: tRNA pseudouridine(38-40) synthase TruA [Candidatus Binataceae bacterium]|nr:tRNA pseudouridine(38-40) synthase TruA [Candidatus Binataceae bacterium]
MRIKLTLEYDGTAYFGWQLQAGQDSIQGRLEAALTQIFSTSIRVHGSGRTDAGVHARGQVASALLPREFDLADLKRALNALLPADIGVIAVERAPDDFDPRRDARSRVYEYRVLNRESRSAFEFRYSWLVRETLDLDAMRAAAHAFIGEHDFATFRTLGSEEKTTMRRVIASDWTHADDLLIYRVEATSFLRHMVRTMVAAMVDAGRRKIAANDVAAMIASRDRATAPAPAPASGLYLVEVRY